MPEITAYRLCTLEYQLLEASANKKKRRDLFKDFLNELLLILYPHKVQAGSQNSMNSLNMDSHLGRLPNSPMPLTGIVSENNNRSFGMEFNPESIFRQVSTASGGNNDMSNNNTTMSATSSSYSIRNIQSRIFK